VVVGLLLRIVRVFMQFARLEVVSVNVAFPRPVHQPVPRREHAGLTQAVGWLTGQALSRCSKKHLYRELIYADPIHH
jgi:hypothetical protein